MVQIQDKQNRCAQNNEVWRTVPFQDEAELRRIIRVRSTDSLSCSPQSSSPQFRRNISRVEKLRLLRDLKALGSHVEVTDAGLIAFFASIQP